MEKIMQVEKNRVVTISYEMKDNQAEILDSSEESGDLTYLHGSSFLVPGFERALDGKKAGDGIQVTIMPTDGYGEYDETLIFQVSRSDFQDGVELYEGLEFEAEVRDELRWCTIAAIEGDVVTVDANHPLAGEELIVQAKVLEIREATPEELEHGHVHGPDDEHHH